MSTVKLGVIGCGVIGSRNLADAMACDAIDVVAAADLRVERRVFAKEQGVPRVYEDGRDLIDRDPEVEAVLLAFPAAARTAMGLRAFARGKHVLTEKPVAMNATEVDWKRCHRAGIDLMCVAHFNPFDEWLSMPTDPSPDAPRQTLRMMDRLERALAGKQAPYARLARNHEELDVRWNIKDAQTAKYLTQFITRSKPVVARPSRSASGRVTRSASAARASR